MSDGPRSEALQERVADLPTSPCWIPKRRGTLRRIRWVPKTLPPCRLSKADVDSGLSRPLPQEGTRYRVAGVSKVTARWSPAVRRELVSFSPLHKYREPRPGFVTAKRQENSLHRKIRQIHPIHGDASIARLSPPVAAVLGPGPRSKPSISCSAGDLGYFQPMALAKVPAAW